MQSDNDIVNCAGRTGNIVKDPVLVCGYLLQCMPGGYAGVPGKDQLAPGNDGADYLVGNKYCCDAEEDQYKNELPARYICENVLGRNKIEDAEKRASVYCNKVKPYFDVIRYHCDKLELLVDDELWPLTKYRELLFTK